MYTRKNSAALRVLALVLAAAFLIPGGVHATEPRASDYITTYGAYTYAAGDGLIQVWCDITGTGTMDDVGVKQVKVYESVGNGIWNWVGSYTNVSQPDLMDHDTFAHTCHVDYEATPGMYYKAYVIFYCGKDGGGDTRYYWTSSVRAT